MRSFDTISAKPTLVRSGNSRWCSIIGPTCCTGACAALVAAARRGLTGRKATVELPGGELQIEWREADDHVLMTGPIEVEFTGALP